jgi:hypothetical protein
MFTCGENTQKKVEWKRQTNGFSRSTRVEGVSCQLREDTALATTTFSIMIHKYWKEIMAIPVSSSCSTNSQPGRRDTYQSRNQQKLLGEEP